MSACGGGSNAAITSNTSSASSAALPISGLVEQIDNVMAVSYAGGDDDLSENCQLIGDEGTLLSITGSGATALCGGWTATSYAGITWQLAPASPTSTTAAGPVRQSICTLIGTTTKIYGTILVNWVGQSDTDARRACAAFETDGPWINQSEAASSAATSSAASTAAQSSAATTAASSAATTATSAASTAASSSASSTASSLACGYESMGTRRFAVAAFGSGFANCSDFLVAALEAHDHPFDPNPRYLIGVLADDEMDLLRHSRQIETIVVKTDNTAD